MRFLVLRAYLKVILFDVYLARGNFAALYARVRSYPVSKTAAATKRLKASSSSPIKYKPLEVDPWICGNAL